MTATQTPKEMAVAYRDALAAWVSTGSADSADNLAEIENDLCGYLNIPLNETEQGLTDYAVSVIDRFVADNVNPA